MLVQEKITAAATYPASERFRLLHRNGYGRTLIKIGAHYVPRRSLILALSESLLLMLSLVLATAVRFHHLSTAQDYLSHPGNWLRFVFMTLTCQLSLYYSEVYEVRVASNRGLQLVRALAAMGISLVALSIFYYFVPAIRLERGARVHLIGGEDAQRR